MAKFTEKEIRALQVPAGKNEAQLFDPDLPGFGVRKFSSGKVFYFVKYAIGEKHRRKTLGRFVPRTLEKIRGEAAVVLAKAKLGTDVVGDAKKAAQEAKKAAEVKTLGDLLPAYLRVREFGGGSWPKLRPTSLMGVTRYLEKTWLPLHGEPVDTITRQMVRRRRDEIASESGSTSANRAHAALSTFFAWAIDGEHVSGDNPTAGIKALEETARKRVLSETELVDIWQACGDDDYGRIVRLLILTGQRKTEIGGLEWSEISVEKRQISLPEARTKNKQPHIVPLSEAALGLLPASRDAGGRFVFSFTSWHWSKQRLDEAIAERRGAPLPQWTLHDIRRSVVTHLAELKFALPHVIEGVVNHVSGHKAGVAGVYNRATYIDEKREALAAWGRYVTGLVSFPMPAPQNTNPEESEEIGGQLAVGPGS